MNNKQSCNGWNGASLESWRTSAAPCRYEVNGINPLSRNITSELLST